MKIVRLLLITAITILAGLIYLLMTSQNPLDRKYDEMVQRIMEEEGLHTANEVMAQYPELKELKVQIQDIKKMHNDLQQITQHPIPPSEKQSLHLINKMDDLHTRKEEVRFQMDQMTLKGRHTVYISY